MNYFETEEKVEYLYALICKGYKASPSELAEMLDVTRRTFYRILNLVQNKYGEVKYCRRNRKYIFCDKDKLE
jgi:DNA invertase Pin-like site-specific DNA recombinase